MSVLAFVILLDREGGQKDDLAWFPNNPRLRRRCSLRLMRSRRASSYCERSLEGGSYSMAVVMVYLASNNTAISDVVKR